MPIISIIVPVYKVEDYLPRCIESILNQTLSDWELILVDDGSPDYSGAICDEYANRDSRIRVIHKRNGGVSSARNRGLDEAKGAWVTFVDSDDYIEPDYLQSFSQDYDFSFQGYVSNGNVTRYNNIIYTKDVSYILLTKYALFTPWAKLFKLSILKANQIRFHEDISYGEDAAFCFEYIGNINSAHVSSVSAYQYQISTDGLASKRHPIENIIKMSAYHIPAFEKAIHNPKKRKQFIREKMKLGITQLYVKYGVTPDVVYKYDTYRNYMNKYFTKKELDSMFATPIEFFKKIQRAERWKYRIESWMKKIRLK